MNQSDATFELVKSLTQNEKRYFRVFSGTTGSSKNYIKVFDALEKMKTFDSKSLGKKLAGQTMNISYEKNYLHKQLLKTLRAFYTENNSVIELQDSLKSIEILYRKRLTAQCQALVSKGLAISEKFEQWHYRLELIEWQYRIYGRTGNYQKLKAYGTEGLVDKDKLLDDIRTYAHVQHEIYAVLTIIQNQSIYAAQEVKKDFEGIISKSLELLKLHKNSFRISELLYSTLYLASHYSGNTKAAYNYALENYKLYQRSPHFKIDSAFKFFVAVGNLVNRCIFVKKYAEGLKYIAELKAFIKQLSSFSAYDIRSEHYGALFGYESRILIAGRRYAEALQAGKEFERVINQPALRKNSVLTDSVRLARVYFLNGLHRESLKRLNELLNATPENVKLDFFMYAHLLRLCIQFDRGNYEIIMHHIRGIQRFMQKEKVEDAFASAFIKTMQAAAKSDVPKKQKQVFAADYPAIKKLVKEPFEHYPDLVEWLAEKIK